MENIDFPGLVLEELQPKRPVFIVTCPLMVHALVSADKDAREIYQDPSLWRPFAARVESNARYGVSLGEVEADGGLVRPDRAVRLVRAAFLEDTDIATDEAIRKDKKAVADVRKGHPLFIGHAEAKDLERSVGADQGYVVVPASRAGRVLLAAIADLAVGKRRVETENYGRKMASYL